MNKGNAFVLDRNRDRSTLPAIQEWGWIGDSGFRAVFAAFKAYFGPNLIPLPTGWQDFPIHFFRIFETAL